MNEELIRILKNIEYFISQRDYKSDFQVISNIKDEIQKIKVCKECGNHIELDYKYCTNCGFLIKR